MFRLMCMLMLEPQWGKVVDVYANVYAHGWGPNGENLLMFMLMLMLMVGIPMRSSWLGSQRGEFVDI